VRIGFDDALTPKNWDVESTPLQGHVLYDISPTHGDKDTFVRQLKGGKNFQFEFTPKGGKPQRSNFKLLNIATLMDQDPNCKALAARVH
jgi:hypothetical protein